MIKQQNDHIEKLDAKIAEHELENEKFKFARSMLYSGRHPSIKDGIGFQQGDNVKFNAPKKLSNFVKGKAPMVQDNESYILYPAFLGQSSLFIGHKSNAAYTFTEHLSTEQDVFLGQHSAPYNIAALIIVL
jgi:hypothetical protein